MIENVKERFGVNPCRSLFLAKILQYALFALSFKCIYLLLALRRVINYNLFKVYRPKWPLT